jgi:hypothetical protein
MSEADYKRRQSAARSTPAWVGGRTLRQANSRNEELSLRPVADGYQRNVAYEQLVGQGALAIRRRLSPAH